MLVLIQTLNINSQLADLRLVQGSHIESQQHMQKELDNVRKANEEFQQRLRDEISTHDKQSPRLCSRAIHL